MNEKKFPPEIEKFFEKKREEQNAHNNVSLAKKNLRETAASMKNILEKIGERGVHVDIVQMQTEELLVSSESFLRESRPTPWCVWMWGWVPEWWWCRRQPKTSAGKSM